MNPEIFEKWENIINSVEKTKIPVEFLKKIVLKLRDRKQKTINIQQLIKQGLDNDEVEEVVSRKLRDHDDDMIGIEFILDIEGIAKVVQPETDRLLKNL